MDGIAPIPLIDDELYNESEFNTLFYATRFSVYKSAKEHLKLSKNSKEFTSNLIVLRKAAQELVDNQHHLKRLIFVVELHEVDFTFGIDMDSESNFLSLHFINSKIRLINLQTESASFTNCQIGKITLISGRLKLKIFNSTVRTIQLGMLPNYETEGYVSHIYIINTKIGKIFHTFAEDGLSLTHLNCNSCEFKNVSLPNLKIFADSKFLNCKFVNAPQFFSSKLKRSIHFVNPTFEDLSLEAQAAYKELRNIMSENNDEELATLLGAMELRAKHKFSKNSGSLTWDRFTSNCYNLINQFGIKIYRPLLLLGCLFIISFITFELIQKFGLLYNIETQTKLQVADFYQPAVISFISLLGPLRLLNSFSNVVPDNIVAQVFFWIYSMLSTILWFFLILGVRRKYKLD